MMVLDSDILIYFLKGDKDVVQNVLNIPQEDIFTTRINYTELLYGAYNSQKVEKCENIIADMDLMIASIVIANKQILYTNNLKNFKRLDSLSLKL